MNTIKELFDASKDINRRIESMKLLYITFILIWEKPEQILTDRDLNG